MYSLEIPRLVSLEFAVMPQHYVKLAENEKNRKLNELLDALEFNQVILII